MAWPISEQVEHKPYPVSKEILGYHELDPGSRVNINFDPGLRASFNRAMKRPADSTIHSAKSCAISLLCHCRLPWRWTLISGSCFWANLFRHHSATE